MLDEATDPWGIKINRVEVKNITPPRDIQTAMEKQMRAERERREAILIAEGEKKSAILIAEGQKEAAILQAEAKKQTAIKEAEGQSEAILMLNKATADGLRLIKEAELDDAVIKLKSLEAFQKAADGQGNQDYHPIRDSRTCRPCDVGEGACEGIKIRKNNVDYNTAVRTPRAAFLKNFVTQCADFFRILLQDCLYFSGELFCYNIYKEELNEMLKRKLYSQLASWKASKRRKAFCIIGARQIGKTTLVREFARNNYEYFAEINFITDSKASDIFQQTFDAQTIITNLTAYLRQPLEAGKTLIFFDEIQKCPQVRTAIKFLVEDGRFWLCRNRVLLFRCEFSGCPLFSGRV